MYRTSQKQPKIWRTFSVDAIIEFLLDKWISTRQDNIEREIIIENDGIMSNDEDMTPKKEEVYKYLGY